MPKHKLSYVIFNNTDNSNLLEPNEAWKFIVDVEDENEAYMQMAKVFRGSRMTGFKVMNVYLNNNQFNPRAWYTDGVNSDNIEYDENIKINQLHDETIKK